MPDNFTSELVDSAGEIFATDAIGGSSVHYPIGKLAWGPLNTANLTDTANPLPIQVNGSGTSSSAPFFVRGANGDSSIPITGTVTIQGNASVSITGGSSVSISNDSAGEIGVGLNAIGGNSGGALQTFTTVLSSALETVSANPGRLYGYMLTNPDTASIVYAKVFSDDSTGVTKGSTSPALNLGIPPEGGANVTFAQGILMSSGISALAAGGAGLTDTSAPASDLVVNLFYKD